MTARLLSPRQAAAELTKKLRANWAKSLVAELSGEQSGIEVPLRPGVRSGSGIAEVGREAWTDWGLAWRDLPQLPDGVSVVLAPISDVGVSIQRPVGLRVTDLEAGAEAIQLLGGSPIGVDLRRNRQLARQLRSLGAELKAATLKAACALPEADQETLLKAVAWLGEHPDLGEFTLRQLPAPGTHTKWWSTHRRLIRELTGRDPEAETRPRPLVVHLSYLDPSYLATGQRRHDAWTAGDHHELAYQPEVVLIVENRDCRLWFPPFPGAVVVEGGGKAASALLSEIPWLGQAKHLVYWGDLDADGYAILNLVRAQLSPIQVASMLMDEQSFRDYLDLGVDRDSRGQLIPVSTSALPWLGPAEAAGYALINAGGPVRRIEQERVPLEAARSALERVLGETG